MSKCRYMMSCLTLLLVLCAGLQAAPERGIPVAVVFANSRTTRISLPAEREVTFKSRAGKVKIPFADVSEVIVSDERKSATLTLVSGEQWQVPVEDNLREAIGLKRGDIPGDPDVRISRLEGIAPTMGALRAPQFVVLILRDGSRVLIDATDLNVPVMFDGRRLDIPVGASLSLKIVASPHEDEPHSILVHFPSGHTQRFTLRTFHAYLRAKDLYGNKLKVDYVDIEEISGPVQAACAAAPGRDGGAFQVELKSGETYTAELAPAVWAMKTDAGMLKIPSDMVCSLRRMPHAPRRVMIRTVHGDVLTGSLAPPTLRVEPEGHAESVALDVAEVTTISNKSRARLDIPDGWSVWYLKSGLAVIGAFADEATGLRSEADEELLPQAAYTILPASDDTFSAANGEQPLGLYRPVSSKVRIALLMGGGVLSVPWDDVYRVESTEPVSMQIFASMLTDDAAEDAREAGAQARAESDGGRVEARFAGAFEALRNAFTGGDDAALSTDPEEEDSDEKPLRLSTALGRLELQPDAVARVSVEQSEGKACVTTVVGDRLLVATPSQRWFRRLLGVDEYEYPEEDAFTVTHNDPGSVAVDGVTCRLMSGDVVRGTLCDQELSIRRSGGRNVWDLNALNLVGVSRNAEGDLVFRSTNGVLVAGTPSPGYLKLVLAATGATNKVPYKRIEVLTVGTADLPPPTVFAADMPAGLRGEVSVAGGHFEQGSEAGMDDEQPVHTVSVDGFYMDATEVTRGQFAAFVRDTDYETLAERSNATTTWRNPGFVQRNDDPVVCVSWRDAAAYCNWRSEQTDLAPCYVIEQDEAVETDRREPGYRLPTEAEWEFAARNRGEAREYPWGVPATGAEAHPANFRRDVPSAVDTWEWTNPVMGFAPVTVSAKPHSYTPRKRRTPGARAVRVRELPLFTRGLAAMLEAGMAVDRALVTLSEQAASPAFKSVLRDVHKAVARGQPLTVGMEEHPDIFQPVYTHLLKPGEQGGKITESLEHLADYLEATTELHRRFQNALLYPLLVVVLTAAIFGGIITFIVPVFDEIYSNMGASLPVPTRILIATSRMVQANGLPTLAGILAVIAAVRFIRSRGIAAKARERTLMKIPVFGALHAKGALCRLTSTLSQTLHGGVQILPALELSATATDSPCIESAMVQVRHDLASGERLATAMSKHDIFPPMLVSFVGVGEQTGKMEKMLGRACTYYEREIDILLRNLTVILEPMMIVVIGLIIGAMVVCMFLPIFQMHELVTM